jgi:hypothetical protein
MGEVGVRLHPLPPETVSHCHSEATAEESLGSIELK